MSSEKALLKAVVRGRVQGVFFRAFVRERARSLGLAGFVRNLHDGHAVEVEAEGERSQLEKLLAQLRKGPPAAYVENVEVRWEQARGLYSSFEIRR